MDDIAYLFVLLFFGMLLGVITGAIAQKKGDSFIAWWLFGTFLFIIALPMVLLMEPKVGRGTATKRCPYCSTPMQPSVMRCPECGRSQPNIGAATSESWQRARAAGDDVEKWAKEHGIDKDDAA